MGLDVRSPIDFMGSNQQLIDQMMQSRLNRIYAEPERQSKLQHQNMLNTFYPMQQAISAQNALSYQNMRGNPSSDYLRAIANMPAKQRELYLSYPENQKTYQSMIDQAQRKMQNPSSQQNFISPEYVNSLMQQFMPQQGMGQQGMGQPPVNAMMQGGQQPPQMPGQPPANAPVAPQPQQIAPQAPQKVEEVPASLEEAPEALPEITSVNQAVAMQYQQNLANIDTNIKQRLAGAVVIDKYLMDNRKQIQDSINSASKYASYWGMGAKKKDEFLSSLMNKDPKGYTDLMWYETAFIPHMSNGIKVMERLSSTNSQREELHEMSDSIINHKLNSRQAKELFNKQIGTLFDISDAVIKTAEPIHKGVTRNIYEMPRFKGNYLETQAKAEKSPTPTNTKGYSRYLEKPILELIKSGGLTAEYYSKLTPEQKSAARKALESHKNG